MVLMLFLYVNYGSVVHMLYQWSRNEINIVGARWAWNPKGWARVGFLGGG